MKNKKEILHMILLHTVTYLLLFVLFPLYFPSDFLWTILFFTGVTILHGIVFWKGKYRWVHRLIGMLLIWKFASWYHPKEIFGISEGDSFGFDWTSASFDAFIVCAVFFCFQTVLVLLLKVVRRIKEKNDTKTRD